MENSFQQRKPLLFLLHTTRLGLESLAAIPCCSLDGIQAVEHAAQIRKLRHVPTNNTFTGKHPFERARILPEGDGDALLSIRFARHGLQIYSVRAHSFPSRASITIRRGRSSFEIRVRMQGCRGVARVIYCARGYIYRSRHVGGILDLDAKFRDERIKELFALTSNVRTIFMRRAPLSSNTPKPCTLSTMREPSGKEHGRMQMELANERDRVYALAASTASASCSCFTS